MKKNPDYLSYGILIVWIVTLALLCANGLRYGGNIAEVIEKDYQPRKAEVVIEDGEEE